MHIQSDLTPERWLVLQIAKIMEQSDLKPHEIDRCARGLRSIASVLFAKAEDLERGMIKGILP